MRCRATQSFDATVKLAAFGTSYSLALGVEATSSLMCCHVEKRSRSEMPRRDHLLSNARAVSLLRRRLQKPCKQRVKACEKKREKERAWELPQCWKIIKIVSFAVRLGALVFDYYWRNVRFANYNRILMPPISIEMNIARFARNVIRWETFVVVFKHCEKCWKDPHSIVCTCKKSHRAEYL